MCAYALNLVSKNIFDSIFYNSQEIKSVVYGCANEKFGGNGSILSVHLMQPNPYESIGGVLGGECKEILKIFYERGNNKLPIEKQHRYKKSNK